MCDMGMFGAHLSPFPLPLHLESLSNHKSNFMMNPNPTLDFHLELVTPRKWNVEHTQ